jgi:hypothetical protein
MFVLRLSFLTAVADSNVNCCQGLPGQLHIKLLHHSRRCLSVCSSSRPTQLCLFLTIEITAPAILQTWWNCWNNCLHADVGNTGRRCSTYRSTVNPAIPSNDCLDVTKRAQFHDYNYAFTGIQGQSGTQAQNTHYSACMCV